MGKGHAMVFLEEGMGNYMACIISVLLDRLLVSRVRIGCVSIEFLERGLWCLSS
jgi:hypothetical protein